MGDWHRRIHQLVLKVEQRIDAARNRRDPENPIAPRWARIDVYRGFGTAELVRVQGRVLRGDAVPAAREADRVWRNAYHTLRRLLSDEVPGARVRVQGAGAPVDTIADAEGYFAACIAPPPATGALWREIALELTLPHPAPGAERVLAPVLVPPPDAQFGVISDLDDTVVRTDAASVLRMTRIVLLGNARTRVPFPGVAAFYRALQRGTGPAGFNPIFYVSSSPWNFYDLLAEFLELQQIPLGPLLLRDWGISEEELAPTTHGRHKLEAIDRVLRTYPTLPFLLLGDSGQQDPEIYREVLARYPGRILAIYIRNVSPAAARTAAIGALAAEVEAVGGTLLLVDETLHAAEHAAAHGWITPRALAELRAECRVSGR